jgi:probable DNA repair protein
MGLIDLRTAISGARQLLDLAGWPQTAHLSSESFQAYRSFIALIDELATHADIVQPRHFAATIRQIRSAADRRLFAPQRPKAAIQVLGYLETIGLEFTHLWVTGLNRSDWPGAPSPTPFIPIRHLRAAAVARNDVDGEMAFARRLMAHWCVSAASVVFSHPAVRDDVSCRRSPLVDECAPSVERHLDALGLTLSHPYLIARADAVFGSLDDIAVGPAPIERLRHRGSSILRDQSACPFRAFARYRLHAPQLTSPHSFPDSTARGTAVHAGLRSLFGHAGSEIEVDPTNEAALRDAVSTAMAVLGPLPIAFRDSERARLTMLLLEWLRFERTRQPYRVAATEASATLSIGGIDFDLRIDRIDTSPYGDLLVLDYKTGPINPNVVIGARLEEPQLPMYALSTPGARAIAFACVQRNECRLVGWSSNAYSALQNAERIRFNSPGNSDDDWNALLDGWRHTLAGIAADFRGGISDVRPRDVGVCAECNLHALCRIRELRRDEFE